MSFDPAHSYEEDQDAYWSSAAVDARIASVGAVHHPPDRPAGLRARWQRWRALRRSWKLYRDTPIFGTKRYIRKGMRREWMADYWAGKVDLETGQYTAAARAESRAAIG